jgi:aspartate/glutamate racemase
MLTCTAFGRLADEVATAVSIPVVSVLEIVADEATNLSDHIGILATHPGTMSSAAQIIQEQTARRGDKVEVKTLLCEGAFEALKSEDWASHDRIVNRCLHELMEEVKVVVIPQPSMERVVKQIPGSDRKIPVLSSAELSVRHLKKKLDELPPKRQ